MNGETRYLKYFGENLRPSRNQFILLQIDRLQLKAVYCNACVKTTPQMTRFRDAKVCNNFVTDEIDDHRIQSDYKCTAGLQNPEGKNSTLGIAYAW